MFGLGMGELLVVLAIVIVVFGASRLPQIGAGLGKGIKNFRKATKELDDAAATPETAPPQVGNNVNAAANAENGKVS